MNVTFRPLSRWPYPEGKRRPSIYRSSYERTLADLEREIDLLKGSEVIIGLVTDAAAIRIDGRLRADAQVGHPGVEVSFEIPDGRRLVFHTDVHAEWRKNVRAIALGLETGASAERGRALVSEAGGLRQALMQNHPDQGGDPRAFADVQAYRQLTGGGS